MTRSRVPPVQSALQLVVRALARARPSSPLLPPLIMQHPSTHRRPPLGPPPRSAHPAREHPEELLHEVGGRHACQLGVGVVRGRDLDEVQADDVERREPPQDGLELAGRPAAGLGRAGCVGEGSGSRRGRSQLLLGQGEDGRRANELAGAIDGSTTSMSRLRSAHLVSASARVSLDQGEKNPWRVTHRRAHPRRAP